MMIVVNQEGDEMTVVGGEERESRRQRETGARLSERNRKLIPETRRGMSKSAIKIHVNYNILTCSNCGGTSLKCIAKSALKEFKNRPTFGAVTTYRKA